MFDIDLWAEHFSSQAEWRDQKSSQHPKDNRNNHAAEIFRSLAAQVVAGHALLKEDNEAMAAVEADGDLARRWTEAASDYDRSVGFHSFPATPSDYFKGVREMM